MAEFVGADRSSVPDEVRHPSVTEKDGSNVAGRAGQIGAPVSRRCGNLELALDGVDHEGEQLVFAGDMPVQRHVSGFKVPSDPSHADGLGSFTIGDRDRGVDDLVTRKRRLRTALAGRTSARGRAGQRREPQFLLRLARYSLTRGHPCSVRSRAVYERLLE